MKDTKAFYASRGFWGSFVAVCCALLMLFDVQLTGQEQAELVDILFKLGTVAGAMVAWWGRKNATARLGLRTRMSHPASPDTTRTHRSHAGTALAFLIVLPLLGACGSPIAGLRPELGTINEATVFASAQSVKLECVRPITVRKAYADAVNAVLVAMGLPHRPPVLDCDGDGVPDFDLDPVPQPPVAI